MAHITFRMNDETLVEVEVDGMEEASALVEQAIKAKYPAVDPEDVNITRMVIDLALPVPAEQMGT